MVLRDWSSLPPELLDKIATHIIIHSDYIRFRAVCTPWRSSTPATPTHLPCQLPWLMLPQGGGHGRYSNYRRAFFNLANNKHHFLRLPEAFHHQRRCRGSSHGWLVIVEESPSILIINPLTGAKLNLPPLSAFPYVHRFDYSKVGREYLLRSPDDEGRQGGQQLYPCSLREMRDSFLKKIVLSDSPSRDPHFTALAIINRTGDLACCKARQTQWTLIPGSRHFSEDVIYYDGLFYAVDKNGSLAICDVSGDTPPQVTCFIHPTGVSEGGDTHYLVAACDEMLLVTRYFELASSQPDGHHHFLPGGAGIATYETREFRVSRLDLIEMNWDRVMNLGDIALFVGGNSSLGLLASDFPGCKGNRIYFTDDDDDDCEYEGGVPGDHDLGIFNLEDGSIERLPCYPRDSLTHPIWITPNPC